MQLIASLPAVVVGYGQPKQLLADISTPSVEDPEPQAKQLALRGTGAYLPAGHSIHSEKFLAYCPMLQLVHEKRLSLDNVPSGQSKQSSKESCRAAAVASSSLYVPTGQRLHVVLPTDDT